MHRFSGTTWVQGPNRSSRDNQGPPKTTVDHQNHGLPIPTIEDSFRQHGLQYKGSPPMSTRDHISYISYGNQPRSYGTTRDQPEANRVLCNYLLLHKTIFCAINASYWDAFKNPEWKIFGKGGFDAGGLDWRHLQQLVMECMCMH